MRDMFYSGKNFEEDFEEPEEEIVLSSGLILEAVGSGLRFLCCHCGKALQYDDFFKDEVIVVPQLALEMGYITHGSCLRLWLLHSDPLLLAAISAGARSEDLLHRLQSVPFESILLDLRRAYGNPPQEMFDRCLDYMECEVQIIEDRCTQNLEVLQEFFQGFIPPERLYPSPEDHN